MSPRSLFRSAHASNDLFGAKLQPDGTKIKVIFCAAQNALKSSISCSDESRGSPPSRLQPGAHSRVEPGGRSLKNFFNEATDLNPTLPTTKIYSVESASKM